VPFLTVKFKINCKKHVIRHVKTVSTTPEGVQRLLAAIIVTKEVLTQFPVKTKAKKGILPTDSVFFRYFWQQFFTFFHFLPSFTSVLEIDLFFFGAKMLSLYEGLEKPHLAFRSSCMAHSKGFFS
jgi:hypothetical protein